MFFGRLAIPTSRGRDGAYYVIAIDSDCGPIRFASDLVHHCAMRYRGQGTIVTDNVFELKRGQIQETINTRI